MPPAVEEPPVRADAPPLPASLSACLPLVWTRVLFPGRPDVPTAVRWRGLFLLVLLPGVLLYPGLGFPLFEPDEGRYAEIAREMLVRGEWVVPYLQGEPYLDKPPLLYWLVRLSYRLLGVHDWSARLVPALAVHACVLITYLIGRRSLGERAGFWGAFALGLSPGFLGMGRLLLLDGLLALWVTLAVLAAFEAVRGRRFRWGWWLLAAAACGLGMLTKGPVAVLLFVPPLWLHRRLAGRTVPLGWRRLAVFAAASAGVALPWYVLLCLRLPDFARHFLWEHNVVRFLSPFDHLRPVWFYGPVLLAGLLPATLLALPFARFLLSGDPAAARRRSPELGFVLLAGGWCVLFFTLSGCKLPTYVLPAFPALALAAGAYLAGSRVGQGRVPAATAGLFFGLMALAQHAVVPWYAAYRSAVSRPADVERYLADRDVPVVCYPRDCDTVAFYFRRDDFRNYRSKEIEELRDALRRQGRTVVLCTHRHSLEGLRQALPPELRLVDETHFGLGDPPGLPAWLVPRVKRLAGETALGLCDIAVVEPREGRPGTPPHPHAR